MGRPRKTELDEQGALSWRKWSAKAWLSDPQLRLCTLAARGLWIDMLNLMMISPRVGYLAGPDRKRLDNSDLSRLVGETVDNLEKLLAELKNRRVYSVDTNGIIFSRRMVREEKEAKNNSDISTKAIQNRERNQDGTLKPWTKTPAGSPARERDRDRKKERAKGPGGDLFVDNSRSTRSTPPWTLDQKREFAWKKVAEALGSDGWVIIAGAADGNADAIKLCKAKAKELRVTWYAGKPEVKA